MKRLLFLALAIGLAAAPSRADDVVLTIAPEAGFSSDHVTLCRVTARNFTGHSIDGRSVAFEARAWENGVAVMTEHGRFGGRIGPGEIVESRIGFNGVFQSFSVSLAAARGAARGARGRAGKGGGKAPKKSTKKSSKTKGKKP